MATIAYLPVSLDRNRKVIAYNNVSVTDFMVYSSNVTKTRKQPKAN